MVSSALHDLWRSMWRSMIHTGARTAETNMIAEAPKSVLLANRDFTLLPAPQPARHAHAQIVEECCSPELAISAPTGPTKHEIIIIIEEVMVIIGNDGLTTNERDGDGQRRETQGHTYMSTSYNT